MSTKTFANRHGRLLPFGVVVAALSLLVTACAGGDSDDGDTANGDAKYKIVVIGGAANDPFWSTVKRGGEDVEKMYASQGLDVTFLGPKDYSNLGPDAARLAQSALAQKPDAVVGPDWLPSDQNQSYQNITKAGVPLFLYNAGANEQKTIGALRYVGADDYQAGVAGGGALGKDGAKHILCVNTLPGSANQEARCKGIADGSRASGAKSEQLALPSSNFNNPAAITEAIKAALLKKTSVDAVVTLSADEADYTADAVKQAGRDGIRVGTFDLSSSNLNRVKDGSQLFAIDQQPYLQGFHATAMAFQYVAYGLLLPGDPVSTGPLLITRDNVDLALAGTKAGVRGAS